MTLRSFAAFTVPLLLGLTLSLSAHHSFEAEFDRSVVLVLKGKIVKLEIQNPHSWVFVEVTNVDGSKTSWGGDIGAPHLIYAQGWTKAELSGLLGQTVTIHGHPAKNKTKKLWPLSLTTEAGAVFSRTIP